MKTDGIQLINDLKHCDFVWPTWLVPLNYYQIISNRLVKSSIQMYIFCTLNHTLQKLRQMKFFYTELEISSMEKGIENVSEIVWDWYKYMHFLSIQKGAWNVYKRIPRIGWIPRKEILNKKLETPSVGEFSIYSRETEIKNIASKMVVCGG